MALTVGLPVAVAAYGDIDMAYGAVGVGARTRMCVCVGGGTLALALAMAVAVAVCICGDTGMGTGVGEGVGGVNVYEGSWNRVGPGMGGHSAADFSSVLSHSNPSGLN